MLLIKCLPLKSSKNVTFNMHSMNYVFFNCHINIQILLHSFMFSICQPKLFLFLNSNEQQNVLIDFIILNFSAKQGDLQLALELEGCLEEIQAQHVTKQLLEAVAFLHDNKIVHLDIKVLPNKIVYHQSFRFFLIQPQNILLMEKWPSTQIKLCDFGLSRVLTNQRLLEMSGTTDFLGMFISFFSSLSLSLSFDSCVFIFKHPKSLITNH